MNGIVAKVLSALSGRAQVGGLARPRAHARRLLVLPVLAALLCGPAASAWASATPAPPVPASQTAVKSPSARAPETAPTGRAGYASREASAKELEAFKGGETTVIIGGGTLLIVLIILLIVLI